MTNGKPKKTTPSTSISKKVNQTESAPLNIRPRKQTIGWRIVGCIVVVHFSKTRVKDKISEHNNQASFTLLTDKDEEIHLSMDKDTSSGTAEKFKHTSKKYILAVPDKDYPLLKQSL